LKTLRHVSSKELDLIWKKMTKSKDPNQRILLVFAGVAPQN
jgi:hypothetical protein